MWTVQIVQVEEFGMDKGAGVALRALHMCGSCMQGRGRWCKGHLELWAGKIGSQMLGGPSLPCFWQGYMGPHPGVMMVTIEGDSKCKQTSSYRAGKRVEFEGFGKQRSGIWKMRLPIIGCCICWMRKTPEARV